MAEELGYENTDFIACDVLEIADKLNEKYDMVFTSEGVLGWLPDLDKWAQNVRACLKDDGVFYIFDSHPFYMMLDESKLEKEEYFVKYPYFGKQPDVDDTIGGYASEPVGGVKAYFWMHTVSEIINSLIGAGLHIVFFNEYTFNFFDSGGMSPSKAEGLWEYPYNEDKYPMSYSLMATVYPGRRERK
jgi:SAM-dependent methyltransferase